MTENWQADSPQRGEWPPTEQQPSGQYAPAYPSQPYPTQQYPQGYPSQPYPTQQYPQQYPQGYPPQPGYGYPPYPVVAIAPVNGLGITGFVCGLIGVLGFFAPYFGLVLGLLGVVFSAYGMASGKRTGSGSGLAIAGLVLGIVAVIPGLIVTIAFATGNYN